MQLPRGLLGILGREEQEQKQEQEQEQEQTTHVILFHVNETKRFVSQLLAVGYFPILGEGGREEGE